MKSVCKGTFPNSDLKAVADAFVELQQARHSADYDYAKVFTRVETLTHINTAKNAFSQWRHIKDRDFAQDFLLAMFVTDRR
jgi:hypothetical protein